MLYQEDGYQEEEEEGAAGGGGGGGRDNCLAAGSWREQLSGS